MFAFLTFTSERKDNRWIPLVVFTVGFVFRFYEFFTIDTPIEFGRYIAIRGFFSIMILALFVARVMSVHPFNFVNQKNAYLYFVIYIPIVFCLDQFLFHRVQRWNSPNVVPIEAKWIGKSIFRLSDGRQVDDVDNLPDVVSPEDTILFYDPAHPDEFTMGPTRAKPLNFEEILQF